MKNLEYDDGTPSRTWVADDYDPIKLTEEQKELVREYGRYCYYEGWDSCSGDKDDMEYQQTHKKELEQKLGLDDE